MKEYKREILIEEEKLIKEIEKMKFSFRKLLKVIELNALLNYYNA